MNKKIISLSMILFILGSILIIINNVFADGWVSPTGYIDSDNFWVTEIKIYDESTSTESHSNYYSEVGWGFFIQLTLSGEIESDKLRYWVGATQYVTLMDVDVYDVDSSVWRNVYQGSIVVGQWVEKSFTQYSINKMRLRFYLSEAQIYQIALVYEVDFWEITAPPDNPPEYSNIGNDGVTQVGESVTVYSYWEDDFELDTCYVEHNNTGTLANYSISVSGSSSWANKTFQLNFTANIKIAYKWWCSDNASQWNSTSYYYITTTQLYVTFNLNNSTYGRFYVDLVNTANQTQNGYDYDETIFLLGATYNASYVWCNFTHGETTITENFYEYQTDGNKTLWSNFDICNATGNGNGNYTEDDLHKYFMLGAVLSAICGISTIIIINKKDLIRGK